MRGLARILGAIACLLAGLTGIGPGPQPAGAAQPGQIHLVSQTSWVAPGQTMSLVLRTTGIADPAALELAVTVHPAVKTRAELARAMRGEGLTSPLGPRSAAAVPLLSVPAAADGTLTVEVPTQDPAAALEPSRIRLRTRGIYPVEVELRELGGGDTVDRFTTNLLAVAAPTDGARLGTTVILTLSAPPASSADGQQGPPAGASAWADTAAGLLAAPAVPLGLAPNPETLAALAATDPTTAAALRLALADRSVVSRPYVPIDVPALGASAPTLLPRHLATGRDATKDLLGRDPITGIWLADEPLDSSALAQVIATGTPRLVLAQTAIGPIGPAIPAPLLPIVVAPDGSTNTATALVSDDTLAAHLDGPVTSLDQPLAAHRLLADLTAIATLPPEQGLPGPGEALDRRVATVLAPRTFLPTSSFLAQLLAGLAESPVLRPVELTSAFALAPEPPAPSPSPRATSTTRSRKGTTTTVPVRSGRALVPLPGGAAGRSIGDLANATIGLLSTQSRVLADPTPLEGAAPAQVPSAAELQRRLLVATSADLTVDQQQTRLQGLGDQAKADLAALKMPEGRTLRLTARAGQLPVGIFNDTGRTARVLLAVESGKLDFPDGNRTEIVLGRRITTFRVPVRVRASGSFRVNVRLLTPDGSEVLQETVYVVRANTVPGVAIAVSGTAFIFLAGWWAKTLLPVRRHVRPRSRRGARRGDRQARGGDQTEPTE